MYYFLLSVQFSIDFYYNRQYAHIGFVFKILDHKMKYMHLSVYRHLML